MASINVRVDDELKKQSEMIFEELGINTSTAINIFLKQVIRSNGIPFTVQADPFYSVENQTHLLAAKERMEKGEGKIHDVIEVDE
ncbi:type II toxin-antitoxin system RelB/DinJ family antitoxin [Lacrimispora sp.]|uniref:type II toxin-antitoxin system RelB/DinJ family antitoxin n=1 Tax=Lacrimispora sp. TaxID=2719234 RepID=UPI0032E37296